MQCDVCHKEVAEGMATTYEVQSSVPRVVIEGHLHCIIELSMQDEGVSEDEAHAVMDGFAADHNLTPYEEGGA